MDVDIKISRISENGIWVSEYLISEQYNEADKKKKNIYYDMEYFICDKDVTKISCQYGSVSTEN